MTVTNAALAISWKMPKNKVVKWNIETKKLTYNRKLICQLLERHSYDIFTRELFQTNDCNNKKISSVVKSKFDGDKSQDLKLRENCSNQKLK